METWVQFVVGPLSLLIVGWILERRVRRVDKKVEGVSSAVDTAAAASASAAVSAATSATAVERVREQVVNDHSSNLREDMDEISDAVKDLTKVIQGQHREFREFRGEMLDFRAATDANHENGHRRMDVLTERLDRHIDPVPWRRFRRR